MEKEEDKKGQFSLALSHFVYGEHDPYAYAHSLDQFWSEFCI